MSNLPDWDRFERALETTLQELRDERLKLEGKADAISEALGMYRNLKRQSLIKAS